MIKSILLITIFLTVCSSNTIDIEKLREDFTQNVIELNIYKKRFKSYLNNTCQDNLECYNESIIRLKSWQLIQNDKKLKFDMTNKKSLLEHNENYWNTLLLKLNEKNISFTHSQFVSIIDLEKQLFIVTLWDEKSKQYYYIGKDLISSGNINREKEVRFGENHYFKTPTGIFSTKNGWRSEGKVKDDNITLGYGEKNRYIFYFGKQESIRYNTFNKNRQKIHDRKKWNIITDTLQFAVHAHKSSKPMGVANSHGCIRMTDELNRFLDNNSVLHKYMYNGKKWLHKYSKEPHQIKYTHFAGEYLVIFDSL